jgi:SAM-dependent methyltransferase
MATSKGDRDNEYEGSYQEDRLDDFNVSHYCRWKFLIPENAKTLLEVGCGVGSFVKNKPLEYKTEVYGVDISATGLDYCRKLGVYKELKQADVQEKIPYEDGRFDVVYCDQVLEHLLNPLSAVKEMKRVLRKDGLLVVNVPTPSHPRFWEDYTHVRPYLPETLEFLGRHAGFKDVRTSYFPHIAHMYYLPNKLRSVRLAWAVFNIVKHVPSNKREAVLIARK